jgi:hypothetical protein
MEKPLSKMYCGNEKLAHFGIELLPQEDILGENEKYNMRCL